MEEIAKKIISEPDEIIMQKIFIIRGQKVMLDKDIADLYGVETKRLKEQVRRNIERFPARFMFELTKEEAEVSRSQNATLKRGDNIKYLPYAFTEHGVIMLSSVLKSSRAIEVSMKIIDVFIYLREYLSNHTEMRLEIELIKNKISNFGQNIDLIFSYLDELIEKTEEPARNPVGFILPNANIDSVT